MWSSSMNVAASGRWNWSMNGVAMCFSFDRLERDTGALGVHPGHAAVAAQVGFRRDDRAARVGRPPLAAVALRGCGDDCVAQVGEQPVAVLRQDLRAVLRPRAVGPEVGDGVT